MSCTESATEPASSPRTDAAHGTAWPRKAPASGHLAQEGIAINGPSYRLKNRLHAIDPGTTTSAATVA